MTIAGLATGTRWYFAIVAFDQAGDPSPLSNVVSLQDIGFRPNANGFAFKNYAAIDDLTIAEMRRVFGDAAVCLTGSGATCVTDPLAEIWRDTINDKLHGLGVGEGLAVASLRFFRGDDRPTTFKPGANNAHALALTNELRKHVIAYNIRQFTNPVKAADATSRQASLATTLAQLRAALAGKTPGTATLHVSQGGIGQALAPFAIEDRAGGVTRVWVYDSNSPNSAGYVEINTQANTWNYAGGRSGNQIVTWRGTGNTHTISVVPLATFAGVPSCPWCVAAPTLASGISATGEVMIVHSGESHVLISNPQGQQIGFDNETFVNDIPNAYASPVIGGLGAKSELVYTVPAAATTTITVDGNSVSKEETSATIYLGPGFAGGTIDTAVQPGSSNQLIVNADMSEVALNSDTQHITTVVLGESGQTQGQQFVVGGLTLGQGDSVTTSVNQATQELVLNNDHGPDQQFNLTVKLHDQSGTTVFINPDLSLDGGDTGHADYGSFDGLTLPIGIDVGSNGSIDQTILARNYGRLLVPYARGR
jgi:hypothetical protein